jgi:hypothetical protein
MQRSRFIVSGRPTVCAECVVRWLICAANSGLGRARDQLLDRDERTKLLQAMTAELLRNRTRTWTSGL